MYIPPSTAELWIPHQHFPYAPPVHHSSLQHTSLVHLCTPLQLATPPHFTSAPTVYSLPQSKAITSVPCHLPSTAFTSAHPYPQCLPQLPIPFIAFTLVSSLHPQLSPLHTLSHRPSTPPPLFFFPHISSLLPTTSTDFTCAPATSWG